MNSAKNLQSALASEVSGRKDASETKPETEVTAAPRRFQGALGTVVGTLAAGVPILIATPFVTKVITDAIDEQGVADAALAVVLYFLVLGVPFVLLALLVRSFIYEPWRKGVWGWWTRWGWSPFSTAKKRQIAIDTAVGKAELEARRAGQMTGLRLGSESAKPLVMRQAGELHDLTEERDQLKKELDQALTTIKTKGQGFAQPSKPTPPVPAPRWTLTQLDDGKSRNKHFRFNNLMPDSIAVGVRVEPKNSANAFYWQDEAYWPDLSGKSSGQFKISLTSQGAYKGFTLRLSWYDQEGSECVKDFFVGATEDDPDDPWGKTPF